ncbi:unnamed protein product [Mycena citricolor]|uniref:PH domain-containing protein n=1 Tax=Mycena citricolor TaxID=2018698 RepID=A0AAD2HGE9_9AGAR|nr:unnamed protein product [Mycena citricolor]
MASSSRTSLSSQSISRKKQSTLPSRASSLLTSDSPAGAGAASEPLYQVKLLNALRSGDPALIHPFLAEIGKEKRKSSDQRGSNVSSGASVASGGKALPSELDMGAASLHLAIRCASLDTISLLLSHRAISPNGIHPPGSGTTPLHLAASLGRADVVNLLLEQEGINDTLLDNEGRDAKDSGKTREVVKVFNDSRAFLNASYRSLLRSYILSPFGSHHQHSSSAGSLSAATPKVHTSPSTSAGPPPALLSLLSSPRVAHVDLNYLDDSSGKSLLHEAARRRDLRLLELAVRAGADVFVRDMRGKLPGEGLPSTTTGYSGGGKGKGDGDVKAFLRQLTNQDPALLQRSPNLSGAAAPSAPPSLRGHLNKYTNVARGWNTRWFVLDAGVLSYYRQQQDELYSSRGAISVTNCVLKPPSGTDRLRYLKANHPIEAQRWISAIQASVAWSKSHDGEEGADDVLGTKASITSGASAHHPHGRTRVVSAMRRHTGSTAAPSLDAGPTLSQRESGEGYSDAELGEDPSPLEEEDEDEEFEDSSASASIRTHRLAVPHEATFELLGNSVVTQLELSLGLLPEGPTHDAVRDSLATVTEYVGVARERDTWWRKHYAKAKAKQNAWEQSLDSAVRESEILERELRARSRKRGSRFFDSGETANGTLTLKGRRRMSMLVATPPVQEVAAESELPAAIVVSPPIGEAPLQSPALMSPSATLSPPVSSDPNYFNDNESAIDTDDEDEFFDAIESNQIPNLVINQALTSPTHSELALPAQISVQSYAGYQPLRTKLHLLQERPNASLWSVLKHSIGKDLTKISFPVFFNEPTSMLQRMAEDMEFSECLDVAAKETDAHRRIAFVAAFAMSNYSSTIGRIAKPFNPMLSETFEYVRVDKEYRYLSEQVSHHPPISACIAESPYWSYFGEVDAQNKFMGKSFEIRPTGIAHAELLLPPEVAPSYPKAGLSGPFQNRVKEHFSWKKVTTNVSGFILGSPTIDHYGDMVITNHRTKDTCILTFKPRGWRGKDAYEISGTVQDKHGRVTYEISGRWNSQLIARQVGVGGGGALNPDLAVSGPNSPSASPEYILLWRNSEKPEGSPFNLTPFAITLNDCPKDTLKPFVCPTDCRLRPDQRAFEMGRFEDANGLKNDQEEKQRATRKAREIGRLPAHRPRWFSAETDGDTGERVWTPARGEDGQLEYWAERERVWKLGGNQPWKAVDDIFIEEPDYIRNA